MNDKEAREAALQQIIEDGEELMKQMIEYTETLKRRNHKYLGIAIGIAIGFFFWMIFVFGWLI